MLAGLVTEGDEQVPGIVVTATDSALTVAGAASQEQRVLILCAGPVCAYVGKVAVQEPPFT